MKQLFSLAVRDLLHNRLQFLCDTALLIGVLVPLMVLLGAKTGVQQSLIADLYSDPGILEIETRGNKSMGPEQRDEILLWAETHFVALKTRAFTDFARVRKDGGKRIRNARLVGTETGDPLLPDVSLLDGQVAISDGLATALDLSAGDSLTIVSDSQDRSKQLRIERDVAIVAQPDRVPDLVLFADYSTLQLFEAYYEGYALPEYGIEEGRDISSRVEDFEAMRIYATNLEDVPNLARKVEEFLSVNTDSNASRIATTLRLGENLNLAFQIIATVAVVGLIAALVSSFWTAVDRKRRTLATLALLGVPPRSLALFPIFQALCLGVASLILAFAIFGIAAGIAESLFSSRLEGDSRVVALATYGVLGLIAGTLALVLGSALVASNRILRIDPAIILRDDA